MSCNRYVIKKKNYTPKKNEYIAPDNNATATSVNKKKTFNQAWEYYYTLFLSV